MTRTKLKFDKNFTCDVKDGYPFIEAQKKVEVCCWCRNSTKIYGNSACKKCYPKLEAYKLLDSILVHNKGGKNNGIKCNRL